MPVSVEDSGRLSKWEIVIAKIEAKIPYRAATGLLIYTPNKNKIPATTFLWNITCPKPCMEKIRSSSILSSTYSIPTLSRDSSKNSAMGS
jgi:hypothetical protein